MNKVRYEPYVFDAQEDTGNHWYSRLDINDDGLIDLLYYANSLRSWSDNLDYPPEAFLQVLEQQVDGSWINRTDSVIHNPESPLMGVDPSLGDFNGDGVLDFVLGGSGWDPYSDGKPAAIEWDQGEPDLFYLSQTDGRWECSIPIDRSVWTHNVTVGDVNLDGLDDTYSSSIEFRTSRDVPDPNGSYFSIASSENNLIAEQSTLPLWITGLGRYMSYLSSDGRVVTSEDTFTGTLLFDANGDHAADLLLLPESSGKTSILLLNDGAGDFSQSTPFELPPGPYGAGGFDSNLSGRGSIMLDAVALDIDHDGDQDLVTLATNANDLGGIYEYYNGSSLQVLRNDGTGQFSLAQTIEIIPTSSGNFNYHHSIEVYDINRDGWGDIVTQSNSLDERYNTEILVNTNGFLNQETSDYLSAMDRNYIPIHVEGELGFVEFLNTGYGYAPEDDTLLSNTTFTLTTSSDFQTGDIISGSVAAEALIGSSHNDTFLWSGGSDVLDGQDGIDTLVIGGYASDIELGNIGNIKTVQWANESVSIKSIERLKADDAQIAIDLDGHAGITAKILGSVFGAESLHNAEYVGIGLSLLDQGWSYEDLALLAVNSKLGNDASNDQIVNLLYMNIVGVSPSPSELLYYQNLLDLGEFSVDSLTVFASETDFNQENIDLIGLAQTGIEFIPA